METQRFVSLRWRFLLPLYIMVLLIVATGAYLVAVNMGSDTSISPTNILSQSRRSMDQQTAALYHNQREAARSVALQGIVTQALQSGHADSALHQLLENRARLTELESVILVDRDGIELLGLRYQADQDRYVATSDADYRLEAFVGEALKGQETAGFLDVDNDPRLSVATPVRQGEAVVGAVIASHQLTWVIATMQRSALTEMSIYPYAGAPLVTTVVGNLAYSLPITDAVFENALRAEQQAALESGDKLYRSLYFPLEFGPETIAVAGIAVPQQVGEGLGQQLTGLLFAILSAAVVIFAFVGFSRVTRRIQQATQVAEALAAGQFTTRTNMQPTDEIGALGKALDSFADYSQARQDTLRLGLRRQRRENERLTAVLNTLPDGVVVQDLDGQVVLVNESARQLLGTERLLRSNPDLGELTGLVADRIGPAFVTGLYSLGDSQQIKLDDKVVSAQAAAVTTITDQRIGNLIVLRDVSEESRLVDARKALLRQIEEEVQVPLAQLTQPLRPAPMQDVAREIRQHTTSLQKLVLEMRELSNLTVRKVSEEEQQPILLDTLVWAVANEWRQVAQAQNLKLHVVIHKPGLYVLGQERRLRWAIGNLVDNAIKYTPPGGDLMLEVRDDVTEGRAYLRLRDNGVGITSDELRYIFRRFYRGNPMTSEGRAIRVSGSGQGLTTARQIIEAHGGTLTIKSKQWVGTAAYFTIPLTASVSLEIPRIASDLEGETVRIETQKHDQ